MNRFLGARELGLDTRWRFRFLEVNRRVAATPGVVYLDCGGQVAEGIIDHHARPEADTCTAWTLVERPELAYNHLLGPWLERAESEPAGAIRSWQPTIVNHEFPDFDSLVSTYLCMRLIEDGDLPASARALATYAWEVDQGRYRLLPDQPGALEAVHLGYLILESMEQAGDRDDETQLRRGLDLLSAFLAGVKEGLGREAFAVEELRPGSEGVGVGKWRSDPRFADVVRELDGERDRYSVDAASARRFEETLLPAEGSGDPVPVRSFIAAAPPHSRLNKYWVRAEGYPYFVCPYDRPLFVGTGEKRLRVVISLDPNYSFAGRRPSLRGLGPALEAAETARRVANHGYEDRGGEPRFSDGSCNNSDPWYDGRGHRWTIVDSPRSGTELPYEQIVRLAFRQELWLPQLGATGASRVGIAGEEGFLAGEETTIPVLEAGAELPSLPGRIHELPTQTPPGRSDGAFRPSGGIASALGPGALLAGRFRLIDLLGEGGIGRVFRVIDLHDGEERALKILHFALGQDPDWRKRFRREIEVMKRVDHPAILRILAAGEDRGCPFFVSEIVHGENLAELTKQRGQWPLREAAEIGATVAGALAAAHALGVIHRDVKPQNIMIDSSGEVKLLDFGLARGSGAGLGKLTSTGAFVGTPLYMSPEQVEGRGVDGRSDLYSLGVVIFEMITGRPPFIGDSIAAIVLRHLRELPPSLAGLRHDVPYWLESAVLRCLEKLPERRFASTEELVRVLRGGEWSVQG